MKTEAIMLHAEMDGEPVHFPPISQSPMSVQGNSTNAPRTLGEIHIESAPRAGDDGNIPNVAYVKAYAGANAAPSAFGVNAPNPGAASPAIEPKRTTNDLSNTGTYSSQDGIGFVQDLYNLASRIKNQGNMQSAPSVSLFDDWYVNEKDSLNVRDIAHPLVLIHAPNAELNRGCYTKLRVGYPAVKLKYDPDYEAADNAVAVGTYWDFVCVGGPVLLDRSTDGTSVDAGTDLVHGFRAWVVENKTGKSEERSLRFGLWNGTKFAEPSEEPNEVTLMWDFSDTFLGNVDAARDGGDSELQGSITMTIHNGDESNPAFRAEQSAWVEEAERWDWPHPDGSVMETISISQANGNITGQRTFPNREGGMASYNPAQHPGGDPNGALGLSNQYGNPLRVVRLTYHPPAGTPASNRRLVQEFAYWDGDMIGGSTGLEAAQFGNTVAFKLENVGGGIPGGTFSGGQATLLPEMKSRLEAMTGKSVPAAIALSNSANGANGYDGWAANAGVYYIAQGSGSFAGFAFAHNDKIMSTGSGWAKNPPAAVKIGVKERDLIALHNLSDLQNLRDAVNYKLQDGAVGGGAALSSGFFISNGSQRGRWFRQINDIAISDPNWEPIGGYKYDTPYVTGWKEYDPDGEERWVKIASRDGHVRTHFSGNYDGNGKRISGLRYASRIPSSERGGTWAMSDIGLFGYIYQATVRNLLIDGFSFELALGGLTNWNDVSRIGPVAGWSMASNILSCGVIDATIKACRWGDGVLEPHIERLGADYVVRPMGVGGIAGAGERAYPSSDRTVIRNCFAHNLLIDGCYCDAGGICGSDAMTVSSSLLIERCWVTGKILNASRFAGGLLGMLFSGGSMPATTASMCLLETLEVMDAADQAPGAIVGHVSGYLGAEGTLKTPGNNTNAIRPGARSCLEWEGIGCGEGAPLISSEPYDNPFRSGTGSSNPFLPDEKLYNKKGGMELDSATIRTGWGIGGLFAESNGWSVDYANRLPNPAVFGNLNLQYPSYL